MRMNATMNRRLPGEAGIWVVVMGDLIVFGLFFLTFVFYRAHDTALGRDVAVKLLQDRYAVTSLAARRSIS